ncbi:halocyanin domain-containing protein [Natronorarus salvus]|uniref:halocyanin domain-containing protein n=1 Tax=Natronorarus salvus TaxID=3117733 RepID=UPI002F2654D6
MTNRNADWIGRRSFTITLAGALAAGLAGCADDDDGDGNGDDGDENGGGEYVEDEPEYDDWFDDVDTYEGTLDMTGEEEVTVMNGAGETGMRFDPPAILVDAGTTVVWEWTGEGGSHDVTHADGEFQSDTQDGEGETFEHTFEDDGIHRYYCTPHQANGQKGAVVVQ